jgi:hypothetical protein
MAKADSQLRNDRETVTAGAFLFFLIIVHHLHIYKKSRSPLRKNSDDVVVSRVEIFFGRLLIRRNKKYIGEGVSEEGKQKEGREEAEGKKKNEERKNRYSVQLSWGFLLTIHRKKGFAVLAAAELR